MSSIRHTYWDSNTIVYCNVNYTYLCGWDEWSDSKSYYHPESFYLDSVELLRVDFLNPQGKHIATVQGVDMQKDAKKGLVDAATKRIRELFYDDTFRELMRDCA